MTMTIQCTVSDRFRDATSFSVQSDHYTFSVHAVSDRFIDATFSVLQSDHYTFSVHAVSDRFIDATFRVLQSDHYTFSVQSVTGSETLYFQCTFCDRIRDTTLSVYSL